MSSIGAVAAGSMALAALALGAGGANAADVAVKADAHLRVAGGAVVPVKVSSASVAVRPTTVGPVHHDGRVVATPPIEAGAAVKVVVDVHAAVKAGSTVVITSTDAHDAVQVDGYENDQGQYCLDFSADVAVAAGANARTGTTASARAGVAVMVGDEAVYRWEGGDVALNGGHLVRSLAHSEEIPVCTGADVCLPAEAGAGVEAGVRAVGDAKGIVALG
ncbi:MAG: hypothetical protein ACRD03_10510 [Acidimicrobiales bacterium]